MTFGIHSHQFAGVPGLGIPARHPAATRAAASAAPGEMQAAAPTLHTRLFSPEQAGRSAGFSSLFGDVPEDVARKFETAANWMKDFIPTMAAEAPRALLAAAAA